MEFHFYGLHQETHIVKIENKKLDFILLFISFLLCFSLELGFSITSWSQLSQTGHIMCHMSHNTVTVIVT